jgi:hypothetical protein
MEFKFEKKCQVDSLPTQYAIQSASEQQALSRASVVTVVLIDLAFRPALT